MTDVNDMTLIQEYADRDSEPAFAGLVDRHIHFVYSVAFRYVGNSTDAQEVTQVVFIILAKKAASLRQRTTLTGWLYEATRMAAAAVVRTKLRQQAREQKAYMQSTLNDSDTSEVWRQLGPVLEEAMNRLNERERALLALRFFENKTAAETAALLGIREDAAHKRAARALEKMRRFFLKRGIDSTTAIIAGAISANALQVAPVALAKSVTAVAITKGATVSGSTLTLIKGALKIMAWTKAKTAIVAGSVVVLTTAVVTPAYIHFHRHSDLTSNSTIASSADYPKTADQAAKAMVETLFVKGDINEFADKFVDPNPILRKIFIENFMRGSGGRLHPMSGAQVVAGKPEKSPDSNIWLVPCKTRLKGGAVRECQIKLEWNSESNRWIFKSVS
jgi:RNA polymerase sigma factor (sigma-70 family)